jgi:hypothetical protein
MLDYIYIQNGPPYKKYKQKTMLSSPAADWGFPVNEAILLPLMSHYKQPQT